MWHDFSGLAECSPQDFVHVPKGLLTWHQFSQLVERSPQDFVHMSKWLLAPFLATRRDVSTYGLYGMVVDVAPFLVTIERSP